MAIQQGAKPAAGPIEGRYSAMTGDREPYLKRARQCASLTVPSLFREAGADGSADTPVPWTSFGAFCVNTLSAKTTLTLFPPGISPIRLGASREVLQELRNVEGDSAKGDLKVQIEKGLQASEKEFTDAITQDGDSTVFGTAMRYLLVGGDHCIQYYPDGSVRGIPLDNYVVQRDGQGNLLEAIIKDTLVFETLPEHVKEFLKASIPDMQGEPWTDIQKKKYSKISLFTYIVLKDGKYEVSQESCGMEIPNTRWRWAPEYLPFQFIPFNLLPGESYGRSYVEDYVGDLQSLDGLEEIVQEGSAANALFIRLVRAGGMTSKEALANARNGAVITGDPNDVATLEGAKSVDLQFAASRIDAREIRLGRGFLLQTNVRNAERVTAEEIRQLSQELNEALGNLYLNLVTTVQKPHARLKMAAYMRSGRMTPLPHGLVNIKIATGAAALSRNAELQALEAFSMPASPVAQQESARIIDWTVFFQRRAISQGIDQDGLVLSKEDQQKRDQAAMQQQAALQAMPQMIQQGGGLMKSQMEHQQRMTEADAQSQREQQANAQQ